MSGDWAKVELNTPDKPEIWMIANALGIDPDAAFGKVFRVWAWFDIHTENGNAPSVSKQLLDRQVGVTGFCDSMLQAGWMVEEGDSISLPNFDKHNGNTAKKRANTSRRVAQHRENKGKSESNARSVTKSVTREEKRREENSNKNTSASAKPEPSPYVFEGESFNINEKDHAKNLETYPFLDLLSQYSQLDLALRDTTKKRRWGELHAKLNYRNEQAAKGRAPKQVQGNVENANRHNEDYAEQVRAQLEAETRSGASMETPYT